MSRVIVTGGRDWGERREDSYAEHMRALGEALRPLSPTKIVQGGCRTGADLLARWWARDHGIECETFHAKWRDYGPAAGPLRNSIMVRAGADYVVACPGGRGTLDCVSKARELGIPVIEVAPLGIDVTSGHMPPPPTNSEAR